MNRTTPYFNTDDGGKEGEANSLKDLETTELGLETNGFLEKVTIGFRVNEYPRQKGYRQREMSVFGKRKATDRWRRPEEETGFFRRKKMAKKNAS